MPYGEKANFEYYCAALKQLTKTPIQTEYGEINIEFGNIAQLSEGQGVYDSLPEEEKLNKKIAILMMGYRNISALFGERGAIRKGETTDLGMVKLSDQIGKLEGITDSAKITRFLA